MKCQICNNKKLFLTVHSYSAPDKYEKWVGLHDINRCWVRCVSCGFYMHLRNYELSSLEKIYKNGYRHKEFRGETIEEAFNRINSINDKLHESENEFRYVWFASNIDYDTCNKILDVGSGIGVWPAILKRAEFYVDCVEENEISVEFLYEKLGLRCFKSLEAVDGLYDCATIVHVLEHIEDADSFLKRVKFHVKPGGFLYVEVPDSIEFTYLDKDHDEFNSCHVAFYDGSSLYKILERNGFTVLDMHREHKTKQRNLSRIMCLAVNQ